MLWRRLGLRGERQRGNVLIKHSLSLVYHDVPPSPSHLTHTHTFYCVERVSQHQRDRRVAALALQHRPKRLFNGVTDGQECVIQSRILQAGGYDK